MRSCTPRISSSPSWTTLRVRRDRRGERPVRRVRDGGTPLFAINLVGFPDDLDPAILAEILRGGGEKVKEAGAVVAGGHTTSDREPKYGLAVTGSVHPDRILSKGGARVGDVLLLTSRWGPGS